MTTTDNLMTIREMCDLFDVTPRTLRFYEAKELIAPRRTGTQRHYGRRDRARLQLILRGKRFGFSLEEIRQLLDLYAMKDGQVMQLERTYELSEKHLATMQAQRAELDTAIAELTAQMDWGRQEIARRRAAAAA
jgi:DNA-binding transcriptional MerR regulator